MLKFILRRFGSSFLVLLGASLLLYVLTINSGDPLSDLRESNADNREFLIEQRVNFMGLDQPWYVRYWTWLTGVGKCVIGQCDLGTNRSGQSVLDLLGLAASSTLRLVVLATVLAMIVGIAIGILTAIRQYSGLDYVVTFFTFMFFSLPVFWAAVLLKEYLAIGFNDWIADPTYAWPTVIAIGLVLGVALQAVLGGNPRRRLFTFLGAFIFVCIALPYLDWLNFARFPQLGPIALTLVGAAAAVGATALGVGLQNRRVLYSGLITAGLGLVAYYATYSLLWDPNWLILFVMAVVAIGVAVAVGRLTGGYSKGAATIVSVFTTLVMGGLIIVEHLFRAWPSYLAEVGRPIATIGSQTPNFTGTFWEDFLDKGTQLLLPTILLALISLATYSRYTRASMLEVSQQDYIRTARAKGLNERQVILKHAFRNSLIPITTIMAFDFASLIGGAVITEQVFGWKGMGELFRTGLTQVDPAPVMAFFLVTGTAAVLFNLLADILYAVLDPRIRV
ncbi:ABC transporter permease [Citricoccus sp. GCM10030269]|uniref:ABC transporter permease n=1 Tax=Citricoccus sp. GCM10030269 TaxID=3273388 RepID=UPI00361AFD4E